MTGSPRVDSELTRLGKTLLEHVQGLVAWAARHRVEIQEARKRHDRPNARMKKASLATTPR